MKYIGIAISGKAAAGKDVVGEALLDMLHTQFSPAKIMKLAAPIYTEAIEMYGMDPSKKDRPLLQRIGDAHTTFEPTFYPRMLMQEIENVNAVLSVKHKFRKSLVEYEPIIPIVTDVRKIIEAEYLRQKGFALVRLDVDVEVQHRRLVARDGGYNLNDLLHWTETDLDHYAGFDMVFPNNGHFNPQSVAYFILKSLGMEVSPNENE